MVLRPRRGAPVGIRLLSEEGRRSASFELPRGRVHACLAVGLLVVLDQHGLLPVVVGKGRGATLRALRVGSIQTRLGQGAWLVRALALLAEHELGHLVVRVRGEERVVGLARHAPAVVHHLFESVKRGWRFALLLRARVAEGKATAEWRRLARKHCLFGLDQLVGRLTEVSSVVVAAVRLLVRYLHLTALLILLILRAQDEPLLSPVDFLGAAAFLHSSGLRLARVVAEAGLVEEGLAVLAVVLGAGLGVAAVAQAVDLGVEVGELRVPLRQQPVDDVLRRLLLLPPLSSSHGDLAASAKISAVVRVLR